MDELLEEVLGDAEQPEALAAAFERLVPGVEPDQWDVDPILDAVELHHDGRHGKAIGLLEGLIAQDVRCLDAWVHFGLVLFETRGAAAARPAYETASVSTSGLLPTASTASCPATHRQPSVPPVPARPRCEGGAPVARSPPRPSSPRSWLAPTERSALVCLRDVDARHRWRTR